MNIYPRDADGAVHDYINPTVQLNVGLWTLFAGATGFLALRIWVKTTRRRGLWYDDHILLLSWTILLANDIIITIEYATGYVQETWDDRMHILINISSCGTLVGQALTKTAFAVTLLKLTKGWLRWVLWFCIVSLNAFMMVKVIFQWAKICGNPSYDNWYRLDFCLDTKFRLDFKEAGNIYNVVMDFVLAAFPWIITWKLDLRRIEKISLCVAMSLGMVVAIVAAIRIRWKQAENVKNKYYFWNNAHSNIWYSSEVVGTIIVQCIPVLRPLLRDIHTSLTSRRLDSTATRQSQAAHAMYPAHANRPARPMHNGSNSENEKSTVKSEPCGGEGGSWDSQAIHPGKDVELTSIQVHSLSTPSK